MVPSKPANIQTVAARAGVSKTTVSFVMNGNPTISEATRQKVLAAAKELGYQPNTNARNLSSQTTTTVCVLVPEIGHVFEDPYFARAIGGVYDELEAAGYKLLLKKASYEFARDKEYLNMFRRTEIAGMLYVGSTMDDRYLEDFLKEPHPFVLVNCYLPGIPIPHVMCDHVAIGREATAHLIRLGHKRIGHIAGSLNTTTAVDRLTGYRQALREAGLPDDENLIANGHYDRAETREATKSLMALKKRPTALFVCNDSMAVGALEALEELGLRCPEDCAIVASDNIELSRFTHPPLTTMDQPIYEIARESVSLLFDIIEGRVEYENVRRIVNTHLIVRRSCGSFLKSGRKNLRKK